MKQIKHHLNGTKSIEDLPETSEDRIALEKETRRIQHVRDIISRIDTLQESLDKFDTLTAAQRTALLKSLLSMLLLLAIKVMEESE